jgi:hypothetical protein
MSRSRLGAEIAFFCNLPCQPTERSEARRGSARLSLIGGARATPIKLNRLISQPDRADGRRPSELQLAVRLSVLIYGKFSIYSFILRLEIMRDIAGLHTKVKIYSRSRIGDIEG